MKFQSKGSAIVFQFALDDREVDLDLVEPAGVHRQVDEDEVGPAPLEPLDRLTAAVGGAVVDDPEDAARGGVGLLGHHPPDESIEGDDPAAGFRAAEDARASAAAAADVEGGQVGERPSALVGVLDSLAARARSRRQRLVDAPARLDRRLLVGADHELARMQQPALPASLVEVEHWPCLLEEGWVGGEDPGAVLPRFERVLPEPAGDRRGRGLADASLDHEPVQLSAREA